MTDRNSHPIRQRIETELRNMSSDRRVLHDRDRLKNELLALSDRAIEQFAESVDEFSYSLTEWLEALDWFLNWQKTETRMLTMEDKIDYLACCAQGSMQTGHLVSLPDLLEDYVESFGVEKQ